MLSWGEGTKAHLPRNPSCACWPPLARLGGAPAQPQEWGQQGPGGAFPQPGSPLGARRTPRLRPPVSSAPSIPLRRDTWRRGHSCSLSQRTGQLLAMCPQQ